MKIFNGKMKSAIVIMWWLVLGISAQAASLNCSNTASKIDKLICDDDELMKLDGTLSKAYQQSLEQSDNNRKATEDQQKWLKEVRNLCKDAECLKLSYQDRISKLLESGIAINGAENMLTLLTPVTGENGKINDDQSHSTHPKKHSPHQKTSLCTPQSLCDKVTLIYSEDDSICKPILQVYQQLWDKNKKDKKYKARSQAHPSYKGYWEDYYPEIFIKAGFVPPLPLRDEQHKYIPTEKSKPSDLGDSIVFYKLRLDPNVAEQTVLLRDYPFASHGDYSSNIYISKPGEDILTACSQDFFSHDAASPDDYRKSCSAGTSYNKLAFATDFRWGGDQDIHAETLISDDYYFEKDHTGEEFSKVLLGEIVQTDIGIGKSTIQRVYLFHNRPIFTARDDGDAVVYRIKNGSQMDDVCYFASNVVKISH